MPDVFAVRGLGVVVDVDLGDRLDSREFETAWSRCLVERTEPREPPTPDRRVVAPQPLMTGTTQAITHELIRRQRGELLMLHAGAVAHPVTGATVAYAAPGGTGKTTLTSILGQRFGYVTDEAVGIEPGTWRVHPYPKPLSIRTSDDGSPKDEVSPDALALVPVHHAPHLAAVLVLRRDPGCTEPRWTKLDLFEAIMALAPETSSLSQLDRPLQLLKTLHGDLDGFWMVEYAQAPDIADRVASLLGEPS
ncbi:MAG TPA: hypothetical protein GX718_00850 [Brevibacterium sp.]|nr:hypothetical protein [Brevibacterium sp.]